MRNGLLLSALLLSLCLAGCPSAGGPDGPIDTTVTWIEDDDSDNDDFDDPEEVDVVWTDRLVIQGEMRDCDYDNDEDWPWTGDLDNYEIRSPARGFFEATLSWETESDLDLMQIVFEGNTITQGEVSASNREGPGEENILFEDEFREDEELLLQVACASGDDGDYELEIIWED